MALLSKLKPGFKRILLSDDSPPGGETKISCAPENQHIITFSVNMVKWAANSLFIWSRVSDHLANFESRLVTFF